MKFSKIFASHRKVVSKSIGMRTVEIKFCRIRFVFFSFSFLFFVARRDKMGNARIVCDSHARMEMLKRALNSTELKDTSSFSS